MLEGNTEPVTGAGQVQNFLSHPKSFPLHVSLVWGISALGLIVSAPSHLSLDSCLPGEILH